MYAPHRTIPHSVKYSTALTEITEYYRACFHLLTDEHKHARNSK